MMVLWYARFVMLHILESSCSRHYPGPSHPPTILVDCSLVSHLSVLHCSLPNTAICNRAHVLPIMFATRSKSWLCTWKSILFWPTYYSTRSSIILSVIFLRSPFMYSCFSAVYQTKRRNITCKQYLPPRIIMFFIHAHHNYLRLFVPFLYWIIRSI